MTWRKITSIQSNSTDILIGQRKNEAGETQTMQTLL